RPPDISGTSVNYLLQACLNESDQNLVILPYYNAANPLQPYSGPTNSGLPQATTRSQTVLLQLRRGVPSVSGTQLTPSADSNWTGLYQITVAYGQTAITLDQITILPTAPFLNWKLPALRPGFGSGVRSFTATGTFAVPQGVSQIEVELWGG